MRPIVIIAGIFLPTLVAADVVTTLPKTVEASEFQLGGAASRAAIVPQIEIVEDTPMARGRLSLPLAPDSLQPQQSTTIGPATLFVGEGRDDGRDALQVGTFLRRGQARAGLSVTYLEEEEEVSRSEVFLDYSLTENFSVGLSGILSSETDAETTVPQLGLSAEYTTDSGAYLQGGFADAAEFDPVFGLSLGFRF